MKRGAPCVRISLPKGPWEKRGKGGNTRGTKFSILVKNKNGNVYGALTRRPVLHFRKN